ncbi:MAG: glycosyltransferase [Sandaracinaceae bacterium]
MKRLFLFAWGPLPSESRARPCPLGRRAWQLAQSLQRAGHEVAMLVVHADEAPSSNRTRAAGIAVQHVSEHDCHERPWELADRVRAFGPDGVVAVGREAAAIAVNHVGQLPMWSDLESAPLLEAQATAARGVGDWTLNEAYRKLVPVLLRSDHISTRTHAHRAAVLGQLGMLGRLIAKNEGYEFVSVVPASLDVEELDGFRGIERRLRRPSDPFYLLWSGAFHPWADLDVLFEVVETLLTECAQLEFAAVGPPVASMAAEVARFTQKVRHSPFHDRIDLPGWVDDEELAARYARADAALFVERIGSQSVFGARARALDWMAAGLPVVCTNSTETSGELASIGAAITVPPGAVLGLRDGVRRLMDEPEDALARGLSGRRHARAHRLTDHTLSPLLIWARQPHRAPGGEERATLDWQPSTLRRHAATLRGHLANEGPAGTIAVAGRFVARRLGQGVVSTVDRMAEPDER